MKKNIIALLGLVGLMTAATSGCVVETAPACGSSYSTLSVTNYADETVDVSITQGPSAPVSFGMYADTSKSTSLYEGTYRVVAIGRATGAILSDTTQFYGCDTSYQLTLAPYNPDPIDPNYATLEIADDTGEELDIYIDGALQNTLLPGEVGQYLMTQGYHTVEVYQPEGDVVLSSSTDYWTRNTLTSWSIQSTYPEVEIHNTLFGAAAECVNSFVDATAVQFDSGFFDVCPAETGYFSVYHGDHELEVYGTDSTYEYVNLFQHFPENTTTAVYVE